MDCMDSLKQLGGPGPYLAEQQYTRLLLSAYRGSSLKTESQKMSKRRGCDQEKHTVYSTALLPQTGVEQEWYRSVGAGGHAWNTDHGGVISISVAAVKACVMSMIHAAAVRYLPMLRILPQL